MGEIFHCVLLIVATSIRSQEEFLSVGVFALPSLKDMYVKLVALSTRWCCEHEGTDANLTGWR